MRAVTLYRLSGLAVLIGMTIDGIASVLYSRAGGVALYLDPLVPADDLAKLLGSLIFLIGLPGLYAFQAARAGRLGLAGFVLSFFGLAMLEVSTEALFAFAWCGWHLLRHPAAASAEPGDKTASSTACAEGLAGSASATGGHDARLPRP